MEKIRKTPVWPLFTAALAAIIIWASGLTAAAGASLYVVQAGDTLSAITQKLGSSVAAVTQANNLANPNLIYPGQRLQIPGGKNSIYTIRPGDTLWDISRRQNVTLAALKSANPGLDPYFLPIGGSINLPRPDRLLASRQGVSAALIWPVKGSISSPFGWRNGRMHQGIDIAVPAGRTIIAAASGRVVNADWSGGYGRRITIDHGHGLRTLYAHCSSLLVKKGDQVRAGQAIARVGTTGNSTGPHLHFEVQIDGQARDPLQFLK
ncbi:MAG: M23 family metallopeptidase [Firmicutes bacterium]|nr:M23 family metallopeptidase [Bacillota bacterium]